jgi:tRNA(adenine34) deaminase
MSETAQFYMQKALEAAKDAFSRGEIPVGAVLVMGDEILSVQGNRCEELCDPTAHAEMLCVRQGCQKLKRQALENASLFVTLEPCPLCAAAISKARLEKIVFGAYDPQYGACVSRPSLLSAFTPVPCVGGVLEKECQALIQEFFQKLRCP